MMTESKTKRRFRRILVGYDGSQESEKAFQVGLSIANTLDSRLEIIAVIQPGEPATSVGAHDALEHARKHYVSELRKLVEAANGPTGKVETSIVVGHPADEIVKHAVRSQSDLVVVGLRGNSKFKDLDIGSVSEHVLACAPCPVLATR
jgi:nucleotide-binding universal stress UspA family protein